MENSFKKFEFYLKLSHKKYSRILNFPLLYSTENNANRVHVMQSAPTIVVSQPQSINIIASSPQLAGKVKTKNFSTIFHVNFTHKNLLDFPTSDDANKWHTIPKQVHARGQPQRQRQSDKYIERHRKESQLNNTETTAL